MDEALKNVLGTVENEERYLHALKIIDFDLHCSCPEMGMNRQGELIADIDKQAFRIRNDAAFIQDVLDLYERRDALEGPERALIERRYRT